MKVRLSVPLGIGYLTDTGLQLMIPAMTPVSMRAGVCAVFDVCLFVVVFDTIHHP